ncbi:hypothetical protein AD936_13740 [Gluconobacter japonicus]|nr:hypothetical protein AD936_13740 [Gluconobacter japonicus]
MSYSPGRSFALGAYLTGSATNGDAWRAPGEDVDADISFERYRSYVDLLEQGRFDSIFLYDNVLPIPDPSAIADPRSTCGGANDSPVGHGLISCLNK